MCVAPGEIHNSVLVAFGEILTFAGAVFGIKYHYQYGHRPSDNSNQSHDTLRINIERPVEYAEAPEFWCKRAQNGSSLPVMPSVAQNAPREIIRLTAIRGRVIDKRRVHRDSVEAYNQLDTVAYKQSAVESSAEHSATTRLYNPPNGTGVAIITILVIGCLIYVFYRKR